MNHQHIRTFASQHRRFLFLLVAASLFLGAVGLLLGMVGPARFLPAYRVQAQDVQAQASVVELDGPVYTSTLGYNGGSTIGITCTSGSGDSRLMLVSVYWQCVSGVRSISGVTFTVNGGSSYPLSLVGMVENYPGFGRRNAIYRLVGPEPGSSGFVTVTFSGNVQYGTAAGVANFKGVDQTTPLGTYASAIYTATTSSTVTDTTHALTVTTAANDLVYASVGLYSATPVGRLICDGSQTELWNFMQYDTSQVRVRGLASTKLATSDTTVMSWTRTAGPTGVNALALSAVPIKPAAVGTTHNLTITVSPGGSGTTNPSAGTHTYAENAVITVTAAANTGYNFDHWGGDCSGSGACVVTMSADKNVTAYFAPIPTYTLTVAADPSAGGTTNPAVGPHTYYQNTIVDITATPNVGYLFNQWQGACSGTGACQVTMNANKTVTASFTATNYNLTMGVSPGGAGTTDPGAGVHSYGAGAMVYITATANSGYLFTNWTGDVADPNSASTTVTMNGPKTVTADFMSTACLVLPDGAPSTIAITSTTSNAVTLEHTTGSGGDRMLLVGVSWNPNTVMATISSVTFSYGAGPTVLNLTEAISRKYSASARYAAIWYSPEEPPAGMLGTVTVNFTGTVSNGIVVGAANFAGVDEADPIGVTGGADASSSTPSVTLSGLAGNELVCDTIFAGGNPPATLGLTDTNQTQLSGWNKTVSNTRGAASTEQATGSSVTMSWVPSASGIWVLVAAAIRPAPCAVSHTLTIAVNPVAGGTTDPTAGDHSYAAGTVVTVTATPATGYVFNVWTGACTGSGDCQVTMDSSKVVTANFAVEEFDFGDAPDSYKTLKASNGPRHKMAGYFMGGSIDVETDGFPSVLADGDDLNMVDDENGVTLPASIAAGDAAASVTVSTSYAGAKLDAWIDFNKNGVFDHPAEHLWGGTSQTLASGSNPLTFAVPATATLGTTYARFRSSSAGNLPPTGYAPDGEVEDYTVEITGITCYALTLSHTGNGTTPTASPTNSTGCPTGQYVSGQSISLSGATPDTGWGIASWTGTISDTSKASTNTVTMPASAHAAGVNYLRLLGDVNKDGKVNSTDALIVLSADAAISTTQFCPMNYGDVNGDGYVNSTDALIILSYDAAMSVPFPLGQPRPEPVLSTQPAGCSS